jgi:hypothetical protein
MPRHAQVGQNLDIATLMKVLLVFVIIFLFLKPEKIAEDLSVLTEADFKKTADCSKTYH